MYMTFTERVKSNHENTKITRQVFGSGRLEV